jgi:cellulase (glycosyl hydrolase family 5)
VGDAPVKAPWVVGIATLFVVTSYAQAPNFSPLHVSPAGIIVDSNNKPVVLRGLNRSGTGSGNADANATDQDYAAQNQLLSMNLVRIFVNAVWWNQNVQVPIANMGYQAYIDGLVQRAKKYGNYVLILKDEQFATPPCGANGQNCTTPQSGDLSCPNPPGCAADTTGNFTADAFNFWAAFAKQYASDPAVLYDTWEDMHSIDNNTWSDNQNAFIGAIRNENPQALIFVEDIDAGQTFESIVAGTLPDLAWSNIVWNFHLYNGSNGNCSEPQSRRALNWPNNIDPLIIYAHQQGHAAAIMEWGGCNDNEPFNTNITTYAQIRSLPLAYFDNSNLITQSNGTYQLTTIGSKIAQAYNALGSGAPVPGNQLTPVVHSFDAPSFQTTIILTNPSSSTTPYALQLYDESGNEPATPVALQQGSLEGTIPPGQSATIRTAGTGNYLGWAELLSSGPVTGMAIYSQHNQLPSIQEGTTTFAPAGSQHFFVPFDNTQNAVTSMALTNPGTAAANITLTLRFSDGTTATPSFGPLAARSHQSVPILPNAAGKSGVAEFVSSVPLYSVAFRFNATGAFTAFDVVQAGASASSSTRTIAHTFDAPSFQTSIILTNTATTSSSYLLQFNNEQGTAPSPPVALLAGSAPLTGAIPAGGSVTIRTAGTGAYLGWAQLTAPGTVGGSVIYSQKNQLPSIQEGTATIVPSGSQHFFLPFDNTNGAVTSLALTNPGMTAANITLTLRFSDGTTTTPSFGPLAAGNHQSVPILPGAAGKSGVAEFTSSAPLFTVAFRFNPTLAFTAFGIVPD